jgi:RNA polymerase sigma factor (sigma-70 family)
MHVRVVHLHNYPGMAVRAGHDVPMFDPQSTEDELGGEVASGEEAAKPKTRQRMKRPSPVTVIARALDGANARPRLPRNPVSIIAQTIERPPDADAQICEQTFWDIWLAHRDYLRAHALRFSGGNLSDAEDALSDAMLKAANAFAKTAIHNQRGWLLRLVHNACMDHHRSNRRQSRLAKDIGDVDAQSAPAIAIQPERSPEELLVAMQQIGNLKRALSELPKFLSEPLMLHLDDRSDAEIAVDLNVTKEVVRKRRQMARALLRRNASF